MQLAKKILVPTDFSECADHALGYAVALADKLGATLHLVNAISIPSLGVPELGVAVASTMMENAVVANQAALDRLVAAHGAVKITSELRTGDARDVIVDVARELGIELIVMGTHGRRGLKRALLGSIAEGVLRAAPCPVLTIRANQ
jgi:universal stress protein A